jgi:hypothetical protein
MTSVTNIPDFDARLAAFLDDPETGIKQEPQAPAVGQPAYERAVAEANSHETCPVDDRKVSIIIAVVGKDKEPTYQVLEPGVNVSCVLGALAKDPDVLGAQPVGWVNDTDTFDDHENNPALRPKRPNRLVRAVRRYRKRHARVVPVAGKHFSAPPRSLP